MLTIDGSMGEGGGQILRSALALSLVTSLPFRITNIRRGRAKPGLMRQHLAAVRGAATIGSAEISGDALGSIELVFRPGAVRGGAHAFATGGAGSTTLVFQTVLYPLLLAADAPSTLRFEGGTHNPMAPPFDFLEGAFLPQLARMGGHVPVALERCGFFPAGGGAWSATITPLRSLSHLELLERGAIRATTARALVARVPTSVAVRELDALATALAWDRASCRPAVIENAHGPGNVLVATVESEHVTEVFTGFGDRGVRAEIVASGVVEETRRYLASEVPVFEHLADQLLLPMALGEGGVFRTVRLTDHSTTHLVLLEMFLATKAKVVEEASDVFRVEVSARS
jgi:RNA 3'-terminal phosphate cyclase (ATP)